MSDKSSIEIRPATDEELKIWQTRPCGDTQCRCTELHLDHAIARIDSARATIAELLAALERFADRRCRFDMPGLCAKVTNIEKCDRCHARAVIQKAKESR